MATDGTASNAVGLDEEQGRREAWQQLPRRLFATFLTLDALFVLLYLVAAALQFSHSRYFVLVNLDAEANPPSWYSGAQLLFIAIGYWVLASRLIPERPKVATLRPLWTVMGVGFVLLSMDEVGSVHERIGSLLYKLKVFNHLGFGDQWMWLYVLIAVALVLIFRKQLVLAWVEWRPQVLMFVLGIAVLVFGAFVMEAIHLRFAHHFYGGRLFAQIALEEGCEMLGATILLLPVFRILSWVMTSGGDSADAGSAETGVVAQETPASQAATG